MPMTGSCDAGLTVGGLTVGGQTIGGLTIGGKRGGGLLPTPVKADRLKRLLIKYVDRSFIVQGFEEGFDIGFEGTQCAFTARNSLSVNSNLQAALGKVKAEVSLGRIAGPFSEPPLENFRCSPLALRAKSTPNKFRLLHNLSYPYDGNSVNTNIPKEKSHLKYESILDAIETLNKYETPFMAKADIKDAYRLVPIKPDCYNLLGFKLGGSFYYDRCLPMGASSSCMIFERISSALKHILITEYKVKHIVKMLDDFLFIGASESECRYGLESFQHLCMIVNIPLAEEKTVQPTNELIFLGFTLDT